MANDWLKVNGKSFSEYVKTQQELDLAKQIAERRSEISADNILYRKPKLKVAQRKERNGKVIILDQAQINERQKNDLVVESLKRENNYHALVYFLIGSKSDGELTTVAIAELCSNLIKDHRPNLTSKRLYNSFRAQLGKIRKSALGAYLIYIDKRQYRESNTFKLNDAGYMLTPDEARGLADQRVIPHCVKARTEQKIKLAESKKKEIFETEPEDNCFDYEQLREKANGQSISFVFNGPVTINFNR